MQRHIPVPHFYWSEQRYLLLGPLSRGNRPQRIGEVCTVPGGLRFLHEHIIKWTMDSKMAPIHSDVNCSMAQANIKERYASASWVPSHVLLHDVPDAEIFLFFSIVAS